VKSNSSLITSINQNSKQSLNPPIKDLLRILSKDMGRPLRQAEIPIIKTAYDKHTICNDYFYRADYPSISPSYFWNLTSTLKPILTRCSNFKPSPYKLNRVYFDETLRIKGMGVTPFTLDLDFDKIIKQCKQQPPQFHDIAINVVTDLHDKLLLTERVPNFYNKGYSIDVPVDPRYDVKVNVNHSKMFVNVGCTNNAFPFTPEGFGNLQFLMGKMVDYLSNGIAKADFFTQPIGEWILTRYHFNHDLVINVPEFRHTINYLREHATLYTHKFDQKTVWRYEENRTDPKTFNQIQEEFK